MGQEKGLGNPSLNIVIKPPFLQDSILEELGQEECSGDPSLDIVI